MDRNAWTTVLAIAERQYGAFTIQQALHAGVSDDAVRHRIKVGELIWEHPGVVRLAGAPISARQRASAALLFLGPESAISVHAAGRLLHLDAIRRPHRIDVHTLHHSKGRTSDRRLAIHRVQQLPAEDVILVDGLRCTTATRTLVDLAAVVKREALEAATMSALRFGTTSLLALGAHLERLGPRRRGARALRQIIADNTGLLPAGSILEVKLANVLRDGGFDGFVRQIEIVAGNGRRYRIDAGWPDLRVGIEADGFEFHGDQIAWKHNRRRIAAIEAMEWQIILTTWDELVHRPHELLERLRHALARAHAIAS
jgi:very-short-patch-repair endonuclease